MATERFIAFAIISVRRVPDAPTSIPATISTVESSTKPVADAASPVNAFSSEMTTGMSAPPIGSTNITPKTSARAISARSAHCASSPAISAIPRAAAPRRIAEFTTFWPRNTIGRPDRSSWSLANAIIEPANETEPIRLERTIETTSSFETAPPATWNSENAISAAAPPPTPLNRATICGIAVIFTVRAPTSPITAPIAAPAAIRPQLPIPSRASVVPIATSIPTPPIQLPRRAFFGEERNRSARMKQMIATR